MKSFGGTAALLLVVTSAMAAQDPRDPATVPATETFDIHSQIVGDDFRISVSMPFGYTPDGGPYPVLYVLDAWWTFGMATDIARVVMADQLIAPILVVGVGYPGGLGEAGALRTRDMTLRQSTELEDEIRSAVAAFGPHPPITTGGADAFLRFLIAELMPQVERKYPVDPDLRVLHGHSLGGNFVVDALFREPKAFTHYIAAAPALALDEGVSFQNEQRYAASHDSLPANLYMAVGALDRSLDRTGRVMSMVGGVVALADTLTVRAYRGLEWEVSLLEGQTHRSVMPVVLRDGMRWAFGNGGK